jgi:hypothetical protein
MEPMSREEMEPTATFERMGGTQEMLDTAACRHLNYISDALAQSHKSSLKLFLKFIEYQCTKVEGYLKKTFPHQPSSVEEVLVEGAKFPTQNVIESWMKFYTMTSHGQINKKVSLTTTQHTLDRFFMAFYRKTGSHTPRELKANCEAFLNSKLRREMGLVPKMKRKTILNKEALLGQCHILLQD